MYLLRGCRTATGQVRGFSSSSSLRVGPESPNFIDVPQSIQPHARSKPRVKGTLPVPREIFPARRTDKPSDWYIKAATPLPTNQTEIDPNDPKAKYISWKRQMADMRRSNLREGLQQLHRRKKEVDTAVERRGNAKQTQRANILQQPERMDETLTRSSVLQSMLVSRASELPDPGREERIAESKVRTEAKKAEKDELKQDHVQELYMNARTFIINEVQLNAEIEKVFPEGENKAWENDHQPGENVWNLGMPPTVQSMVNETVKSETGRWDTIQDRVKKLGEQITGGKL